MCYGCSPGCDNCKPKFMWCRQCGERMPLIMDECIFCGYVFTEEDREQAVEAWKQRQRDRHAARQKELEEQGRAVMPVPDPND